MPNVLVHGGGCAASCWDKLVPWLDEPTIAVVALTVSGIPVGSLVAATVPVFGKISTSSVAVSPFESVTTRLSLICDGYS